jgi:hypothetical protein
VTGAVDTDITGWTHTLDTTLAENTVENRQLALVGGTIEETPAVLGTATTTVGDLAAGATIVNVTSVAGFDVNGFAQIGGDTFRIVNIAGSSLTLDRGLTTAVTTGGTVSPVTELGTRRIGYGTPTDVPFHTYALISQKKDGTLYMAVFRKCKVTGGNKDQTFEQANAYYL